jgi:hypothetical protein
VAEPPLPFLRSRSGARATRIVLGSRAPFAFLALSILSSCRAAESPPKVEDTVEAPEAPSSEDAWPAADVSQPPSDAPDSAPNADTEEPPDVATTDPGAADGAELEPVDLAACRAGTPDWLPLPEASGAARLSKGRYIVVADSGNEGRALIVDESQGTSTAIALPLGEGAGDDLEGLDVSPDGRLFGVTSAGWLRAWRIEGDLATLVLGPVAVSDDADWCCGAFQVNCGPNYEGFCLHPEPTQAFSDGCEGWLVSKAKGELVCLRQEGESYRADPSVRHPVAPQNQLSGCAYEPTPPYRLVVAANVYSGDRLWEVGEDDMEQLPETGAGNQESVLVLEGERLGAPRILSFGDLQELSDGQSPRVHFECR